MNSLKQTQTNLLAKVGVWADWSYRKHLFVLLLSLIYKSNTEQWCDIKFIKCCFCVPKVDQSSVCNCGKDCISSYFWSVILKKIMMEASPMYIWIFLYENIFRRIIPLSSILGNNPPFCWRDENFKKWLSRGGWKFGVIKGGDWQSKGD